MSLVFWIALAILEGRVGKFFVKMFKLLKWKKSKKERKQTKNSFNYSDNFDVDEDVIAEEKRIAENYPYMMENNAMIVKNLRKNFGKLSAVKNISFGVERAECFGMLGENGAGKTTTFKLITGAIKLTSGDVWINKYNTKTNMDEVFKDIGYCPQFDGLLNNLTGRETLEIICRIRGIQEELIQQQIVDLSKLLQFSDYIDRVVDEYSGGTKRKLSFAIVSYLFVKKEINSNIIKIISRPLLEIR